MPFEECADTEKLPVGIVPTVPLSAMTVKGTENLFVAGRCISTEREVMGAMRVKVSCMAMGQAVGTAAALCKDGNVRGVDINEVKRIIKEQGGIVPDKSIFAEK